MKPEPIFGTADQLCAYTGAVLGQMAGIATPYVRQTPDAEAYPTHVGPHLRHAIEHYETLARVIGQLQAGENADTVTDYDARERELRLDTDPQVALARIAQLTALLGQPGAISANTLARKVQVLTRGGLQGEHNFNTPSTVGRELMFLNSHATHHFAIVQGYLRAQGQTLGAGLGKAPATVAYEQQQRNQSKG
jgi:hypothetical protein